MVILTPTKIVTVDGVRFFLLVLMQERHYL